MRKSPAPGQNADESRARYECSRIRIAFSPWPPSEILELVTTGEVRPCHDARILSEYRQVLLRPKFSFEPARVESLLDRMEAEGIPVDAFPLSERLPDPDDEAFLAAALAGEAQALVTGNLRHYPARSRQGVQVIPPQDFLEWYRRIRSDA